jgi:Uma2 family endonuclease
VGHDDERPRASYQDVLEAAPGLVAEVLDGVLYTQGPLPVRHAAAATALGGELGAWLRRSGDSRAEWFLLHKPEVHLGHDIVVPDIAGWRRSTAPEIPDAPFMSVRPDWACEVLSRATVRIDRALKLRLYRRELVPHVWLLDPSGRLLDVYCLEGATYRLVDTFGNDATVRAPPFDAVALELSAVWGD